MKKCKNCLIGFDYKILDFISFKEYINEKDFFNKNNNFLLFNYCPKCGHKVVGIEKHNIAQNKNFAQIGVGAK